MSYRNRIDIDTTSANFFLVGPTGNTGAPGYRAIVGSDIPSNTVAKASLTDMTQIGLVGGNTGAVGEVSLGASLSLSGTTLSVTNPTIISVSGTYTAVNNTIILANTTSAGFTITLPSAASLGQTITIKKVSNDTNVLTVVGNGSDTIDAAANFTFFTFNESLSLTSTTATNWSVL